MQHKRELGLSFIGACVQEILWIQLQVRSGHNRMYVIKYLIICISKYNTILIAMDAMYWSENAD